jgi:hypothetical protein
MLPVWWQGPPTAVAPRTRVDSATTSRLRRKASRRQMTPRFLIHDYQPGPLICRYYARGHSLTLTREQTRGVHAGIGVIVVANADRWRADQRWTPAAMARTNRVRTAAMRPRQSQVRTAKEFAKMRCLLALLAATATAVATVVLSATSGTAQAAGTSCPSWSGTDWNYTGCAHLAPRDIPPSPEVNDSDDAPDSPPNTNPRSPATSTATNALPGPTGHVPSSNRTRNSSPPSTKSPKAPNSTHRPSLNGAPKGQRTSIPELGS